MLLHPMPIHVPAASSSLIRVLQDQHSTVPAMQQGAELEALWLYTKSRQAALRLVSNVCARRSSAHGAVTVVLFHPWVCSRLELLGPREALSCSSASPISAVPPA